MIVSSMKIVFFLIFSIFYSIPHTVSAKTKAFSVMFGGMMCGYLNKQHDF